RKESKTCKCNLKDVEHHAGANSSFLHAVINMVGMLIGLGQLSTPYALENGAIFGGVKANYSIPALQLRNIPYVSGLYIFSFAGHIVFPDLHRAMKDPSKFTKVSIVSFSLVTILYTALAFMGAKLFGPEVNSQITLIMPRNLVVTKIALWATVLTPMTKYALEFAPFAMHLEHHLPHSMKSKTKMIIRVELVRFFSLQY
ncbi:hypothetical protein RJ639_025391, partial [Escallonia herrerae]